MTDDATLPFQRQHDELARLAAEIAGRLDPAALEREAPEVRRLVARFAGKLRMHAAMENEALYPRLRVHPDPEVRDAAERLWSEVGTIYGEFDAYSRRWLVGDAIARDPRAFVKDTHAIIARLGVRMMRESRELYPLAVRG
jgi:hypothetical protein